MSPVGPRLVSQAAWYVCIKFHHKSPPAPPKLPVKSPTVPLNKVDMLLIEVPLGGRRHREKMGLLGWDGALVYRSFIIS